jgi:DNA-binding transcriptional MerR regulator
LEIGVKFKELSDVTGLPVRELRYLMSIGVIPVGKERGRFADAFDDSHVIAAKRYQDLSATGLNARQIAALSDDAVTPAVLIRTSAFELRVLPGATATDFEAASIQHFLKDVRAALRAARPKTTRPPQTQAS